MPLQMLLVKRRCEFQPTKESYRVRFPSAPPGFSNLLDGNELIAR
jgi:hypothetical protein